MKLGAIADDFTGASDLANNLVRAGMRVVQTIGVPSAPLEGDFDAVVIALKSRTAPVQEAVQQSLAALTWLRAQGASQIYFKYCSTFDSTPEGNIGPVTEALMDALGTDFTVATPAFPDNGRTVFKGHLFVGDVLLQESGMQHHPLTPMTDSHLVRVLQAQTRRRVGLVDHAVVAQGPQAITARLQALRDQGVGVAILDALSNPDLLHLGAALAGLPLVTAGSGLAIGLPANWGLQPSDRASQLPPAGGRRAIVSGSCSRATLGQVAHFQAQGGQALALDPLTLPDDPQAWVEQAVAWAAPRWDQGPLLVYSSAPPQAVQAAQAQLGLAQAGERTERALAAVARAWVLAGVRQLVVAGGETSGACVQALGIRQMQIGPQIDPGVPWCHARHLGPGLAPGLHLALKSGNFGSLDFFSKAFASLP